MMTAEQFDGLWAGVFPGMLPIPHLFKHNRKSQWFRIHSLPQSKRYADTEEEWEILLGRQNTILTDILGDGGKVFIVTGDYHFNDTGKHTRTRPHPAFSGYDLKQLEDINLNGVLASEYDPGAIYRPCFAEVTWKPGAHDQLLKAIASDETRAFFVLFSKALLAAPYDGGIDFILKDADTRDAYRNKYKEWLSAQESGL